MKKIILADNQDISKLGFLYLINNTDEVYEVEEANDKKTLINLLIQGEVSLVIIDYTLFDFESVNDLVILQNRFVDVQWIVFSDALSDEFVRTLLYNTQNFSVLMKDNSVDEIRTCLKETLKGNRFICNFISNMLLDNSKRIEKKNPKQILTPTETEILKELALGKTTREIANIRHASIHTIMTHRKNIFRKIEVNNIHEATKYAIRAGIVDMTEYYI